MIPTNCPEPEIGRRARRAEAMVAAAKTLFLEKGYDAVSLTQIVRQSGGSLATLYGLFGNKLGLLAAVIDAERNDGIERLKTILFADGPPAMILQSAAIHLLDAIDDPDFVGLIRLVMSEALTSPEFAARVYADNNAPLIDALAMVFAEWDAAGRASFPNPEFSAHIFAGLFFHAPQLRTLFRDKRAPESCAREQMIGRAVAMFLAGASIPDSPPVVCTSKRPAPEGRALSQTGAEAPADLTR